MFVLSCFCSKQNMPHDCAAFIDGAFVVCKEWRLWTHSTFTLRFNCGKMGHGQKVMWRVDEDSHCVYSPHASNTGAEPGARQLGIGWERVFLTHECCGARYACHHNACQSTQKRGDVEIFTALTFKRMLMCAQSTRGRTHGL